MQKLFGGPTPNVTIVDEADCTSKCCIDDVETVSSSDSHSTHESRHFTDDNVFLTNPPVRGTHDEKSTL